MTWLGCEGVSDEYVHISLKEMDSFGTDPRAIETDDVTDARHQGFDMQIVRSGQSSLQASVRL